MSDDQLKTYAVAYYCHFSNELAVEIVHAHDWREACVLHSETCFKGSDGETPDINEVPHDLDEAKQEAFSRDNGLDIKQLVIDTSNGNVIIGRDPDDLGETEEN